MIILEEGNTQKKTKHLFLTHHWFDEILKGRKNVEYREVKMTRKPEHYCVGDTIVFHRGYTSTTTSKTIKGMVLMTHSKLPEAERNFFKGKENSFFVAIEFI